MPSPTVPIDVPAARVVVPPSATMSIAKLPPSRIAPIVVAMSTALMVVFVVTTLPRVTSPTPLISIRPLPASRTVASVAPLSVIVMTPVPVAPALTSISPVVVVTSPATVNVTSLPAEVSVTWPVAAETPASMARSPLPSLSLSPATSVMAPTVVVEAAPDSVRSPSAVRMSMLPVTLVTPVTSRALSPAPASSVIITLPLVELTAFT